MKKIILLLTLLSFSFLFFSCGSKKIPANDFMSEPYRVTNIWESDNENIDSNNDNLRTYYLKSNSTTIHYRTTIMVVDSIGKFDIGDEVYFVVKKRE